MCKDIAGFRLKVAPGNFKIKIWICNPFFVDIDGITDSDFAKDDLTSGGKKSHSVDSSRIAKDSAIAGHKAAVSGEREEIQQATAGRRFIVFCLRLLKLQTKVKK